mgnify:FL=1
MIVLPDVNTLIAIAWPSHRHHAAAAQWFRTVAVSGWATTSVTESAFVRLSMNAAVVPRPTTAREAIALINRLRQFGTHVFWADDTEAADLGDIAPFIQGYRQVTDAHLLVLAGRRNGAVATLDTGFTQLGQHSAGSVVNII